MEERNDYCPVVGTCSHEPVDIQSNSYFLIQPFDNYKTERENAINDALKKFHGGGQKYELNKSDLKILDSGVYCDICYKIKSSQFCIVDMTGEIHKIIDESGKTETKVFLRPNVALELGMAYGFNKQALIMSSKLNGKNSIPSDIEFIRYIDTHPVEFMRWKGASQKLLDRLRSMVPPITIKRASNSYDIKNAKRFKKHFKAMLHLKENLHDLKNKRFTLNQFVHSNGSVMGIIHDSENLIENICFNLYSIDDGIEQLVGIVKCHHVQSNGLVQVKLYAVEGGGNYLENVTSYCFERGIFVPGEHRLELIISEEIEKIKIEEIKIIIDNLSLIKG